VEVDGDVESTGAKPPRERHVVADALPAGRFVDDDQVVDVRVAANDSGRMRFDEVGDVGVGITGSQRGDNGRRKDDVADEPEPNKKDLLQGLRWLGLTARSSPRRSASPGCRP
jgi:hypothetical protein